ncbi:MAG: hypothetical protein KJ601_00130, partial [Nanoarchaeota archaeon]|nr:hypothetical protein [Nanoarchaeota archaeon]
MKVSNKIHNQFKQQFLDSIPLVPELKEHDQKLLLEILDWPEIYGTYTQGIVTHMPHCRAMCDIHLSDLVNCLINYKELDKDIIDVKKEMIRSSASCYYSDNENSSFRPFYNVNSLFEAISVLNSKSKNQMLIASKMFERGYGDDLNSIKLLNLIDDSKNSATRLLLELIDNDVLRSPKNTQRSIDSKHWLGNYTINGFMFNSLVFMNDAPEYIVDYISKKMKSHNKDSEYGFLTLCFLDYTHPKSLQLADHILKNEHTFWDFYMTYAYMDYDYIQKLFTTLAHSEYPVEEWEELFNKADLEVSLHLPLVYLVEDAVTGEKVYKPDQLRLLDIIKAGKKNNGCNTLIQALDMFSIVMPDYSFKSRIASGVWGTVYKAEHSGRNYIIKVPNKNIDMYVKGHKKIVDHFGQGNLDVALDNLMKTEAEVTAFLSDEENDNLIVR